MSTAPVGFLGFGEAGFHIARGLRRAGAPPLIAFDINANRGTAGERIRLQTVSSFHTRGTPPVEGSE